MESSSIWREYVFDCLDAEEEASKLIGIGAGGVEILSPTSVRCFVQSLDFLDAAKSLGFKLIRESQVSSTEWLKNCAELWEPITLGAYKVLPIPTSDSANGKNLAADEIHLIPGLGFGTGHHIATRFCAEMLQRAPKSARILDLGTGSGLLAIIAAKFHSAAVDAIDIDEMALENARENIALNRLSGVVAIKLGSIESARGPYDLIVANLYAELLCSFEDNLFDLLSPHGTLIVSGIANSLRPQILAKYASARWLALESPLDTDWCGFRFQKLDIN